MRLRAGLLLALVGLAVAGLWASGTLATLGWRLGELQRAVQGSLASEIAALKGGERAALAGLIGLCGAYGFLHALGPGHGKALIAGAAVGTRSTARRMALIALAGSLAQAGVAIALVYGGFTLLGVTARGLTGGVAAWLEPLGNVVIALIGAWLLGRGFRALRSRAERKGEEVAHGPDCGHAHGPTAAQTERATGLGTTLALIGGMAARPCTGAIFVLVIAWRMELPGAGAAAVLAMGLGTAAFTALVGWLAVGGRDAAFLSAGSGGAAGLLAPGLQIGAGAMILAISVLPVIGAIAG